MLKNYGFTSDNFAFDEYWCNLGVKCIISPVIGTLSTHIKYTLENSTLLSISIIMIAGRLEVMLETNHEKTNESKSLKIYSKDTEDIQLTKSG